MSTNLPVPVLAGEVLDPPAAPALLVPAQADTDRDLIALWVARSASPHTRRNYRRQTTRFLAFVNRPLAAVRLGDVQAYLATLEGQAPATRANATAALKSLFSFAQETGYLRFNLGKVFKAPPVKNRLAERILDESAVHRMLALEAAPATGPS
jgi:site-specific recombinase XerD